VFEVYFLQSWTIHATQRCVDRTIEALLKKSMGVERSNTD
jgi:hypothetical protein